MFDLLLALGPIAAFLLLIAGFVPLIYGADRLVEGASSLAASFKIPPLVIGLTIVAFGTSAPELTVNLLAASEGSTQIAIANILGSNVFNILGILGICALIFPLAVQKTTTWIEIPLVLLSAVVIAVVANDFFFDATGSPQSPGTLTRTDGIALLGFFSIFLVYNILLSINSSNDDPAAPSSRKNSTSVFMVVAGLFLLILGGKMIVDGGVSFAQSLGISQRVIGLTIVAVGTSLPELATSIIAALKKKTEIAVGNVVGSNIFNVFFILGLTATIAPLPLSQQNQLDLWINIGASLLLFLFLFTGKRRSINRVEGGIFAGIYLAYVAVLIVT